MYGFIYNTLRSLVVENHGEEVWRELCSSVGADEIIDGILDHHYYDEKMVHKLVVAASEKLGVSNEEVLQSFGHFFFKTCKKSGHSSMLRTLGHDLHGFLMNLDSLHDHLSFTYTQMQAPSFRCDKTSTGLTLHYHSQRSGLDSIVKGIVEEVAKDFYNLDVKVNRVCYEETNTALPHHYVFNIEANENSDDNLKRLTGEVNMSHLSVALSPVKDNEEMDFEPTNIVLGTHAPTSGGGQQIMECPFANTNRSHSTGQMISADQQLQLREDNPDHALTQEDTTVLPQTTTTSPVPDTEETYGLRVQLRDKLLLSKMIGQTSILPTLPNLSRMASRRGSTVPVEFPNWPITPHIFQNCFPFHIIFDYELTIRYMGISLSRILPKAICSEAKLTDYFDLSRPSVPLTYQNIRESIHNIFILCTKQKPGEENEKVKDALQFRGQMIPTSSKDNTCQILFLASPRISTIEELEHQGLYLSDIPVHDVTRDLLLLNRHFRVEMNIATELEKTKKELQEQKSEVEKEKKRADDLLHAMLPRSVADELISGNEARAMDYSKVTILFSDIKGFTTICNQCQPMQVVGMLNMLYTRFDALLELNNVYKVETIGDAYMVAAGLLDTSKEHAQAVTNMAFGMREEAGKVIEPVNNQPIQIRIGIHSGPVVAGVVGKKMPRYCLFGDTVNTASRMESHGEPGYVHISEETFNLLKGSPYVFYSRGKITIKGLGQRQTYFVEPPSSKRKSHLVLVPNDSDSSRELPVVTVDGEPSPSISVRKEEVLRSPSFVTYNKCAMVVTPSTQFLHTSPSNPNFEDEERERRSSSPGLEMRRIASTSTTPMTTPMTTPKTSTTDSPETQFRKNNKIAPHKAMSRAELRPPSVILEDSESGRTSRNSTTSGSVIDAFISKNGTAPKTSTSVDPGTAMMQQSTNSISGSGSSSSNEMENEQENSTSGNSDDSGDSSSSSRSRRQSKKAKCVIS